ncbi:Maf family protein [Acidaminobacter sp.]|uniref:Maf family protein n=1 Tax=Acidaminobacter sp. TaxID=1872102 RepID=UPI00256870BA|nr:Maf family protein [Acidaminobacter sp.]MDK9709792.1 Maf family protein [Acidaminobacter sp.]
MRRLLLASESPRRRELIGLLGREVVCEGVSLPEPMGDFETPEEIVMALSFEKAWKASQNSKWHDYVIIGSDTIVCLDGRKLGKPENEAEAHQMLMLLSGRTHQVFTGLCLICPELDFKIVDYSVTEVEMGPFSAKKAWSYVHSGEVFGKAGAYAIQGLGSSMVKAIHGDFFTVVGLPVYLLGQLLEHHSL